MQQVTLSRQPVAPRLSRWKVFTAAPHRVMFFPGMVQGVAALAWWLVDLGGRYAGWYAPIAWAMPAPWAHAFLAIYAFLPFFMFGFLMTAVPNWLNVKVPRGFYLPAMLLMAAGCALFYPALLANRELITAALLLVLAGWGVGLAALFRLIALTAEDVRNAAILCAAMSFGWIGVASLVAALYWSSPWLPLLFSEGGIWFFALPVFISISNRMVPFFASRALQDPGIARPPWSHALLLTGSLGHGALVMLGYPQWTWLFDLPMCVTVGLLALRWGFFRSFRIHLLAVLHLSLAALALALALFAIQSLVLLVTGEHVLGRAPLHAMTIGYFSAMVIGMVSRVSLGHSGRMLTADRLTWHCFLGMLGSALLRVAGDLPGVGAGAGHALTLMAGVLWLACFASWVWRYLPIYLAPRVDQRPG
ncbi:MAG: NnrS family protein [Burkholderiales bacterium]